MRAFMGDDWERGDGSTLRGEGPEIPRRYQERCFDASSTEPDFFGLWKSWRRKPENLVEPGMTPSSSLSIPVSRFIGNRFFREWALNPNSEVGGN
jgi:hypothetical protein